MRVIWLRAELKLCNAVAGKSEIEELISNEEYLSASGDEKFVINEK